jgi:hypothetical protein
VCAAECTEQVAVSHVGREHLRAQTKAFQASGWGRPQQVSEHGFDASDDANPPRQMAPGEVSAVDMIDAG